MPDLTPKPLRSSANAVINLMGAVGSIYTLILIQLLVKKEDNPSYMPVFVGVALIMIVSIIILVITIREKKLAAQMRLEGPEIEGIEETESELKNVTEKETQRVETRQIAGNATDKIAQVKRSLLFILFSTCFWYMAYNAVTTAFSRYAITIWKIQGGGFASCLMVAMVAAIISYIPIGFVSAKLGRKKTIMIGLLLMLISYSAVFFYPTYNVTANFFFALVGIGWAAINVNSYPMVVEMSKNSDIGKYTGLYYTFSMAAQIFTPILSGLLLQHISYHTLFPYAIFFTVCAIATMSQVKHGDVKPFEKKKVLENFDVEN